MRKTSKLIACVLCLVMSVSALSACGTDPNADAEAQAAAREAAEIKQNDFRGGYSRTKALRQNVLGVMENMKQNNVTIREDNPNSYWTKDGYEDFVVNFLNKAIITDTQWFNEEETSWEDVVTQMRGKESTFTMLDEGNYKFKNGVKVTRNEKDDYAVTGVPLQLDSAGIYTGVVDYRILYDCDKDWCKAYGTMRIGTADLPSITADIYEYGRIDDNTYAIQTNMERLVVVLDPVEADTDLRERTIKEFYYSKLTLEGARTTFTPYTPLEEYQITADGRQVPLTQNQQKNQLFSTYALVNEEGDLATRYGAKESMFLENAIKTLDPSWVFEDKSLQQAIIYKDGALVCVTFNKLAEQYEKFVYKLANVDDSTVKEIEGMIEIKNLVGIQEIENGFIGGTPSTEPVEGGEETPATDTESVVADTPEDEVADPAVGEETAPEQELPDGIQNLPEGYTAYQDEEGVWHIVAEGNEEQTEPAVEEPQTDPMPPPEE